MTGVDLQTADSYGPHAMPVTEQTPLLREDTQQHAPPGTAATQDSEFPLAQEPSTRELILILGSIWVGVFLAALGMIAGLTFCGLSALLIPVMICRYYNCCDSDSPDILVLSFSIAALVAGNCVSDFQCRISTH